MKTLKQHLTSSAIFVLILAFSLTGIWYILINSIDLFYRAIGATGAPKYIEFNALSLSGGILLLFSALALLVLLIKRRVLFEHILISYLLNVFLFTALASFIVIMAYTPLLSSAFVAIGIQQMCGESDSRLESYYQRISQDYPENRGKRVVTVCNFKDRPFEGIYIDQVENIKRIPE